MAGRPKKTKKKFRSKFEASVADQLEAAGVPYEYESVKIPYQIPQWYTPDFVLPNGIVIECKGYFTPQERRKHLEIQKEHPDLDIRFVFQKNNKLHPKSPKRYSDWCEAHGFKYAIGEIPEEWIKEEG